MRQKFSILTLACLPLLACGGDDTNNKKGIILPDSKGSGSGSGSGSGTCAVQPMYAALGNHGAVVDHPTGAHPEYMALYTTLTAGTGSAEGSDATLALLFSGGTYWPTAISGGSGSAPIAISASDGDYATCELCFFVSVGGADLTAMTIGIKDPTDVYLANSGTFMIQQRGVNNGSAGSGSNYFFATVSNLHFGHVALDDSTNTSMPIADGCTTTVGSGDYGYIPEGSSAAFTDSDGTHTIPVRVVNARTPEERRQIMHDFVLSKRHI